MGNLMGRITKVCGNCGSTNVLVDAFARWDEESQKWVLDSVYEKSKSICEDCNGDTKIKDEPLD